MPDFATLVNDEIAKRQTMAGGLTNPAKPPVAFPDPYKAPEADATPPTDEYGGGFNVVNTARNPPPVLDTMGPKNDALAASVGQDKLGPAGLKGAKGFLTRADLSFTEDNTKDGPDAKMRKFKATYPEGDIKYDDKTGTYLQRTSPDQPYAKLTPQLGSMFKRETGDPIDIGSVADQTKNMLVGGAAALSANPFIAGAAAMGADATSKGVEGLRGYNAKGVGENVLDAAKEGIATTAGMAATKLPEMAGNYIRGGGLLQENAERTALRAKAKAIGLPDLTAGQASEYPNLRRLQAYSETGSSNPVLPRYVTSQQDAALDALSKLQSEALDSTKGMPPVSEALTHSMDQYRQGLLKQLGSTGRSTAEDIGKSLEAGLTDYQTKFRKELSVLYNDAYANNPVTFNLAPTQKLVNEIESGTPALGKGKPAASGVLDAHGNPMMISSTVNAEGQLSPEFRKILDDLKEFNPNMGLTKNAAGETVTPAEQLIALRHRLFDFKTPRLVDPTPDNEIRLANRLYSSITDTLENPKKAMGMVGDPKAFVSAWQKANDTAKQGYELLDSAAIVRLARQQDYAKMSDYMTGAAVSPTTLAAVQKIVGPQKWQDVSRSFENNIVFGKGSSDDVLDAPFKILQRMDRIPQEKLNMFMSPARQQAFREVGRAFDRFDEAGMKQILSRQETDSGIISNIINTKNQADITQLANIVPKTAVGTPDLSSPVAKQIRAGIFDDIKNSVIKQDGDTLHYHIDQKALLDKITELRDSTADRFLTPNDKNILGVLQQYSKVVNSGNDVGVNMQGAALTGGMLREKMSAYLMAWVKLPIMSQLMVSPKFNDFLYGVGAKQITVPNLHRMAGALSAMYAEQAHPPTSNGKTYEHGTDIQSIIDDNSAAYK